MDLKTLLINEVIPRLSQPLNGTSAVQALAIMQAKIAGAKVGTCLCDYVTEMPTVAKIGEVIAEIKKEASVASWTATHLRKSAAVDKLIASGSIVNEAQMIAAYGAG